MKSPHVLMLFLDGVGIGAKDPAKNPFFAAKMLSLKTLLGGVMPHSRNSFYGSSIASLRPLNATLGVGGLPQSGTGQTALLTGRNAARIIGKHFGPYPYSTLRPILSGENIFRRVQSIGKVPFFANAYPRQYFEYIESHKSRRSAMTMSWISSGYNLNDSRSLGEGRALSADITNERWNKLGFPHVSVISPQEAGRRLIELTIRNDFVLYEYYLTDHAGHKQSMAEAVNILETIDELIQGILDAFDHHSMTFILTSDHGNMEDLSTKSHTRNPVPLLVVGKGHRDTCANARNLTHVVPAILKLLG